MSEPPSNSDGLHVYPMAPLIRSTLVVLYLALVLPLPSFKIAIFNRISGTYGPKMQ